MVLEDKEWGYVRTRTPLMAKSDLYKISGHWDHYMDGMFILNKDSDDKETMALRPMTCPFQYYVYMNEQHSYRDLPYRMSETSTLFRNEDSGEMHGLTRVRQFTITEAHIILCPEQAEEELTRCTELCHYVMTTLGIDGDVTYRLSKWDPNNKEKYLGDEAYWNSTQQYLRDVMDKNGIKYTEADGEAAFYGPKIDIPAQLQPARFLIFRQRMYMEKKIPWLPSSLTVQVQRSLACTISMRRVRKYFLGLSIVHPWDVMSVPLHG